MPKLKPRITSNCGLSINKIKAIICTVVFTVIHGYQIQGFISCLAAGLVFTLIYDKTGKILEILRDENRVVIEV